MIVQYLADGVTPLADYVFPVDPEAGQQSAFVTVRARNTGDTELTNALLVVRTESLVIPDRFVSTGVPVQDELWPRARITGFTQGPVVDPTWFVELTGLRTLGAWAGILIARWPPGAEIIYDYGIHAPGNAAPDQPWTTYPGWIVSEHSQAVPPALTEAMRGVLHGIGVGSRTGVVWMPGEAFLPVTSANDELFVGAGMLLYRGQLMGFIREILTFDQHDVDAEALEDGEKYIATVYVGPDGQAFVKSARGADPAKPAAPADEPVLGWVTVLYNAGGTVIEDEDVEWRYVYDRFHPAKRGAMLLGLNPGRALGGGTLRYSGGEQLLPLDAFDASTCYVWQLDSGLFEATAALQRPDDGAELHCEVTLVAGEITEIVDRCRLAGEQVEIRLRGVTPAAPGVVDDALVSLEHLVVDHIDYRIRRIPANVVGSAGWWLFDSLRNGDTLYTDNATEDWRPVFEYDAAGDELSINWTIHQATDLYRGDVLSLDLVEIPTGADPVFVEAVYVCRVP